MLAKLHRDDLIGVIAVIVLAIGTATGNAYVMLAASLIALALVLAPVYRRGRRWGGGSIALALLASVAATAVGVAAAVALQ